MNGGDGDWKQAAKEAGVGLFALVVLVVAVPVALAVVAFDGLRRIGRDFLEGKDPVKPSTGKIGGRFVDDRP